MDWRTKENPLKNRSSNLFLNTTHRSYIKRYNMKASGKDRMLTAPVITRNGRVMLPLTDIQRALKDLGLDVEVKWEHNTKTVRN